MTIRQNSQHLTRLTTDLRVGNQHWKKRKKHGRDKLFKTPELLWEAACDYFQWCEDNPFEKVKFIYSKGEIIRHTVTTPRPFTLRGLCLHLKCNSRYFRRPKASECEDDYSHIIGLIRQTIFAQQFEGACAGLFNPRIISRSLSIRSNSNW